MKTLKKSLVLLLIISLIASLSSCYIISAQKMDKVKGTYKLSSYTYTPSYERKNGYVASSRNYVTDEKYLYEDYLIVTGSNVGYYVHKDAENAAYVKEIRLSYQYATDNPSAVEYVSFNDSLTLANSTNVTRLGVTKNALNFSKPAFDYVEPFTKREMRTEDISMSWERVDRATDLSYAISKLGNLKEYGYTAFGARGIFELTSVLDLDTQEEIETEFQYYLYVIDTAKNVTTATIHYALKSAPEEKLTQTVAISSSTDDWNSFTLGEITFTKDSIWNDYFYCEINGEKLTISRVSYDISESTIEYLINDRTPTE